MKMLKFPKNFFQKIGTISGISSFFFGLWQMDMIVVNAVWGKLPFNPTDYVTGLPLAHYADGFFQMGWLGVGANMTVGIGYDICQILMVGGLIVALLSLWFWNEIQQNC